MGRINGDSLVGLLGRKLYDASYGRIPEYEFGVDRQRTPISATVSSSKIMHTLPNAVPLNSSKIEDAPALPNTAISGSVELTDLSVVNHANYSHQSNASQTDSSMQDIELFSRLPRTAWQKRAALSTLEG
jgi:hypothetical protein